MTCTQAIQQSAIAKTSRHALLLLGLCGALSACQHTTSDSDQLPQLQGLVIAGQPLANAVVILRDAQGETRQTTTDNHGNYSLPARGLTPPLRLSAVAGGKSEDCQQNATLRPICMAAVIETLPATTTAIANINPLTDRIVSDLAVAQGFIGPQQWIDAPTIAPLTPNAFAQARRPMQAGFAQALKQVGIKDVDHFDPATYPLRDNSALQEMLGLLNHNRNYDNNSGSVGHTSLSDPGFRPLVGLQSSGAYETFDLSRARQDAAAIRQAKTRVFIVGDSTSAVYEQLRYPRMGWGQVFEAQFADNTGVKVVVGSRAGRSSRDFYNGRWFAQMEKLIQPGDYVFINHGHNDQNCDASKPLRGAADVANLCTYPNNAQGQPQYPAGKPELAFYHSLERYVKIARERGAMPVLFTPTARIKNAQGAQTTPVVHSHLTRHKPGSDYAFVGDYSQTIMDLARAEKLPLIDLEKASIAFANRVGEPGWRDYWLVVDKSINPYYSDTMGGSTQLPDGTHFQKNGAEAMAQLVANVIRRQPELAPLAALLRQD